MAVRRPALLDLLAADLAGYRREDTPTGARFTPAGPGQPLEVSVKVERRFLGRTEVARFHLSVPASSAGPGRIRIRHTGARTRIGIEALVKEGDRGVSVLAAMLEDDERLASASLPLDFKRFELVRDEAEWQVSVELMGASLVAIAMPPMRSYVRLFPDQRAALAATFSELRRVLSSVG